MNPYWHTIKSSKKNIIKTPQRFFDDLVKKSKINKEENKLTNKELVALDKKA